jgi:carboxyl-terminal processing protease
MLQQFLSDAARQHVMNKGYRPLLIGGLTDLEIFADTTALGEAFGSMKDKEKLAAFKNGLIKLQNEIGKIDTYGFSESMDTLSKVLDLNKETIGLPEAVLVYEMAEGSVSTLDDFSAIIWPYDKEAFGRNFAGKFYGVGILIRMKDERIFVDSPIENSPALKAGIKSGDFIVKVDGADTTGWSLDQIVRKITGPKGTTVNVGIERGNAHDILYFKLTRDEIQIESVKGWQRSANGGWDYYLDRENQIGYIRLSQFIPQSADDIDHAVNAMQADKGLKGLILDLRQNPGGLLTAAVNIVNKFVPSGIIVSTAGLDAKPTQEFYAQPKNAYKPFPVIVLINEGSASASEIVSGALQDYHRALIMGSRSYGKGSVQDVFQIDSGKAYVKITTQYYRLPTGRIIHRQPEARTWGIEPDLKVDVTPQAEFDQMEARQKLDILHQPGEAATTQDAGLTVDSMIDNATDAQLAAALIVMKTQLLAERDKAVLAAIPAPAAPTTQPVAK